MMTVIPGQTLVRVRMYKGMLEGKVVFSADSIMHYLRSMGKPSSLLYAACGMVAGILNYITNAPVIWKAMGLIAIIAFVLDSITGYTCSVVLKRYKYCSVKPEDMCRQAKAGSAKSFNSRDFGASFIKFLVYATIFLLAIVLDEQVSRTASATNFMWLSSAVLAAIIGREITSNFENCRALWVRTREPWPFSQVEEAVQKWFDRNHTEAERDAEAVSAAAVIAAAKVIADAVKTKDVADAAAAHATAVANAAADTAKAAYEAAEVVKTAKEVADKKLNSCKDTKS